MVCKVGEKVICSSLANILAETEETKMLPANIALDNEIISISELDWVLIKEGELGSLQI